MVDWFDNERPGDLYATSVLHDRFEKMLEFIRDCLLEKDYHNRPNCDKFLDAMNSWSVTDEEVMKDPKFSSQMTYLDQFDNKFFINFIRNKLGIDN